MNPSTSGSEAARGQGHYLQAIFAPSRPAHTRRRSREPKYGPYCVTTAQGARLWAPRAPDLEQRLDADAAGRYSRDSGRPLPYPTEWYRPGPVWPSIVAPRTMVLRIRPAFPQGVGRTAPKRPPRAVAAPYSGRFGIAGCTWTQVARLVPICRRTAAITGMVGDIRPRHRILRALPPTHDACPAGQARGSGRRLRQRRVGHHRRRRHPSRPVLHVLVVRAVPRGAVGDALAVNNP